MRLRHIEVFHAIYTTGSITNAAQFLHVSQPSVSKVLAHAEQQLGFALFERVKGRLIPTEQAKTLFNEVDTIYRQLRSVRNTAENIKNSDSGQLNIGITPALGFDLLPKALIKLKQHAPKVHTNIQVLHNENVQQALMEHKIDVAFMFSPPPLAGIKSHHLCQSELVVMHPEHYFSNTLHKVSTEQLNGVELIGIKDSGPLADVLFNRLTEDEINISSSVEVQTYFIAARLVSHNMGLTVVDEFTAQGNITDGVTISHFEPPINFSLQALHLNDKPLSHLATQLLGYIREELELR